MKQRIGFLYRVEHMGRDGRILSVERVHNLMPTAATNYMLAAALTGGQAVGEWHMGLFGNDRRPLAEDTAASFLAEAGEIDTYEGGVRRRLELSAPENGATNTLAAPNVFEFGARARVLGAFVTSAANIGDAGGLLLSAALFNAPKIIEAGEALRVPAAFFLVSE